MRDYHNQFWDSVWSRTDAWERSVSNEDDLLSKENDRNWDLIQRAAQNEEGEADAFKLYLEAAHAGSVWSQEQVGCRYWTGKGVAADRYLALDYYHSAICGGSWTATISYARLLAEVGRYDECDQVLNDGVSCGFAPSYFWLAWLRYSQLKTRRTRKEVRPLLEYAANQGHPYARLLLYRWMGLGKLSLRDVPVGLILLVREALLLPDESISA